MPAVRIEGVDGRIPSADGRFRLFTRVWRAPAPDAVLVVVHGLGEHAGRYARLAAELAGHGITVFAFDQRGHGRSGGARGHVVRFERLLRDVDVAVEAAGRRLGDLPRFVLGHSFGGLVALRWLQTRSPRLRGAILSAPLLEAAVTPPRWQAALSGVLSRWLPAVPFSNQVDPADLSRVPEYVRSYRDDPLVHDRITPRMYTEICAAAGAALGDPVPELPLLFLVPGADRICVPGTTLELCGRLPGDVTVRHYPEARHESFNDEERTAVVADMVGWLRERL